MLSCQLTTGSQAFNDVIAEAEDDIMYYKQPENMSALCNLEALWEKALRCERVYEESRFNNVFVEGLHSSIRLSMKAYWGSKKVSTLQNLARYATFVFKL